MTERTLEDAARRAVDGDRESIALVVRELQAPVHALALRMLWQPHDAEDATQEILVRVVTRLAQFDFRSSLKTWVYRVASNYLLDVKKSCVEQQKLNFDSFSEDLVAGLSDGGPTEGEESLLTEEVKVGCTLAMLQCIDRPHRLAYVLGEIFDMPAPEAASAMGLEPSTFRKRLQRARETIEAFTRAHCGLVSNDAPCHCNRRVPTAVALGRVSPEALRFAERRVSFTRARDLISRVKETQRVVELHRTAHPRGPERDIATLVIAALDPEP